MGDIETTVRRIVALSDVSTTTKRMVRNHYKKLTGVDAITALEKKIINSTLDKIVLELAQKMQARVTAGCKESDKEIFFEKEKTIMHDSWTQPAANLQNICIMENCNEISKEEKSVVVHKNGVCEGNSEPVYAPKEFMSRPSISKSVGQRRFTSKQPDCNNMAKLTRVGAVIKSVKPPCRLTSSEVLATILTGDTSDSEFSDCSQKNLILDDPLSGKTDCVRKQGNSSSGRRKIKRFHSIDVESDESEENFVPSKKCNLQERDVEQTAAIIDNQCVILKVNRAHQSNSQTNIRNNSKELSSQNDIPYSPPERCRTDHSVKLVATHIPKLREDPVIDISSDSSDNCLTIDELSDSPSSQFSHKEINEAVLKHREKKNCIEVKWKSDVKESCLNIANSQRKQTENYQPRYRENVEQESYENIQLSHREDSHRASPHVENEDSEVSLLSDFECNNIYVTELVQNQLLGSKKVSFKEKSHVPDYSKNSYIGLNENLPFDDFKENSHTENFKEKDRNSPDHNSERESNKLTCDTIPKVVDQDDLSSDDSFTSFCKTNRRKKLNKTKRFFDTTDSEFDNNEFFQTIFPKATKLSGKNATVEIKVVERNSPDVCEIKDGVLTDLDIIENIERSVSKGRHEKPRRAAKKSRTGAEKMTHHKRQIMQQRKSVIISHDKIKKQKSNKVDKHCHRKKFISKGALECRMLDSDSESDIPLSYLRSSEDFTSINACSKCKVDSFKHVEVTSRDIQGETTSDGLRSSHLDCNASDRLRNNVDCSACKATSHARHEIGNTTCEETRQTGNEHHKDNSLDILTHKRNSFDLSDGDEDSPLISIVRARDTPVSSKRNSFDLSDGDEGSPLISIARAKDNTVSSKRNSFDLSDGDEGSPLISIVRAQNTTVCSKRNSYFSSSSSVNNPSDDDTDEHFSTPINRELQQESDIEETSSSLSNISPIFLAEVWDKENNGTLPSQTKPPESSELSRLRVICRTVGIILRNTKELAGCISDEEKVQRIKQLLKKRGMEGTPSLQKAERLNLLKELEELQYEKKQALASRETRGFCGSLKRQRNIFDGYGNSTFSGLRGVVTEDDSESS